MLFQKPVLTRLFDEVEEIHQIPLWKVFCNLVAFEDLPGSGASEYEIYFNYALSKSNQFSTRDLKSCNLSQVLSYDAFKRTDFDVISLHAYARSNGH